MTSVDITFQDKSINRDNDYIPMVDLIKLRGMHIASIKAMLFSSGNDELKQANENVLNELMSWKDGNNN